MNQKALLLVLTILSVGFFTIAIIKSKEVKINMGLSQKLVLGFLIAIVVSLFVSGQAWQGYWGYSMQSDSLFCFILFSSLFFLFSNIFNENNRENAYKSFTIGAFILGIIYLFQIFLGSRLEWKAILPGNEESAIIFSLGLIFAINCIFKNFDFKKNKNNLLQIIFASIFSLVFVVMLYIMGIKLAWFLAAIGGFFIFWKGMQKRKFDFNYPEPFISFLLTIFFLANFLLPLNDLPILKPFIYSEPVITYSQSVDIIKKSFDSPQKLFFGTGPASFPYNFSLYKGEAFSTTDEIPNHPNGAFFLILNDFGVIGSILFLSILILFAWQAIRFMMKEENNDNENLLFISATLIFFLSLFFYRFSFVITSLFFMFLGLYFSQEKRVELSGIKDKLFKVFISIIILFLISNLYFFAQYEAERNYQKFRTLSNDTKFKEIFNEEPISLLENSVRLFDNADYSIYLSRAYLSRAISYNEQYFATNVETDAEEKNNLSLSFAKKSEESAKKAININPKNFFVWENLGMIYEDLERIDTSKKGEANRAYEKAKELAPFNYEIYVLYGRKLEKDGDTQGALVLYKKALKLKPDFVRLKEVINSLEN
ncbi:MAG: hypothetical protein PHR47_01140 [Candidatus Pacebacteria bacterium]|nr:hypothetical protein [Candidatus Paceibacterota bacterium]